MSLARVLVVHNHYQQPGGEDNVFAAEADLLRAHGHAVETYSEHNRTIGEQSSLRRAVETVWSTSSVRKLSTVLRDFKPDIAHFHNTFPLISPSAYYACERADVAVVQTLHHYRWGCPSANFYRDGKVCEDCLGKLFAWPGALHGCYHGSRPTSAVIGVMNAAHDLLGTWRSRVDRYIALSNFQRTKLIEAGLPADKIEVKGNFVDPDPGVSEQARYDFLYVGRLIPEKGVNTLLRVWNQKRDLPVIKVVGDGPLAPDVIVATREPGSVIDYLGRRSPAEVRTLMDEAAALVVPSEWHEPFGLVAIEAFACGTPVIAARSGALPEIVEHGRTGLLFDSGNITDLMRQVRWAAAHPVELAQMGRNAREVFEQRYTAERNYAQLAAIYQSVIDARFGYALAGGWEHTW